MQRYEAAVCRIGFNVHFTSFAGGFSSFQKQYPEMCEESLKRNASSDSFLPCYSAPSLPSPDSEATIERTAVTEVLPYLYLGNARDAQDVNLLQVKTPFVYLKLMFNIKL